MPEKDEPYSDILLPRLFKGPGLYLMLAAGLFILYLLLSPFVALYKDPYNLITATDPYAGDVHVHKVMAALLFLLFVIAVIFWIWGRLTAGKAAVLLILAGVVLRYGTMLYTPFYIHGHDVSTYGGYGHLAYIYRLYEFKGLPGNYGSQFYHPPLTHAISAAVARLYALITGEENLNTIMESTRLVPCFASTALMLVSARIFTHLRFSKRAFLVALAVVAFHPTFILMSSSINNDMLMIFFFMTAFLYTLRWYKDPSYKNILLLALAIGCAMSTKFSGGLIAVITAFVFLLVLIRKFKEGASSGLVGQFAAFAAICFPLGLWYQVRNLKLFGQPLGYVAQLSTDSALYVGDHTLAERFLSFSLRDILTNVYCDPFTDFRLWEYTVKCALFGEFTFPEENRAAAVVLILSSLVLILLSIYAMLRFLLARRKNKTAVLSFFALWLVLMLSFIFFNIKYPFGCTMDFRYIVPTVITGAGFLGLLYDRLSESRYKKTLSAAFIAVLSVFCGASAVFYIL